MWELQPFRSVHLPGMTRIWNEAFAGGPSFVRLTEADLRRRAVEQPSFDPAELLVEVRDEEVVGFVHFGFRSNLWSDLRARKPDPREGHIYVLVARPSDRQVMEHLLDRAVGCLTQCGARQVLLGPSWVFGTQPFYNGIAGAYEIPGLDPSRRELLSLAADRGFVEVARYGTSELALAESDRAAALRAQKAELMAKAREWNLHQRTISLDSVFFEERRAVLLSRDFENVAMTAFGPWHEYQREHGRTVFGITSVQVAEDWRGRGLGKLVMLLAMEAAASAGAEALHLHVHEGNQRAWRLYHDALGFAPGATWVTLATGARCQWTP